MCNYVDPMLTFIKMPPQAPDRFNPNVRVQTCGIIQKLFETKHIETMMFGKSHSAFFKDRAKNVKVRHEKMAKNSQKWVKFFLGMFHMLDNNICNLFLFLNFFLLALLRPCF